MCTMVARPSVPHPLDEDDDEDLAASTRAPVRAVEALRALRPAPVPAPVPVPPPARALRTVPVWDHRPGGAFRYVGRR